MLVCVCPPDLLLSDKRLFETKRKDQLNALKNLVELNDINQQYKIIDIMLKGLFKVCVCVCVSAAAESTCTYVLKNRSNSSSRELGVRSRALSRLRDKKVRSPAENQKLQIQ